MKLSKFYYKEYCKTKNNLLFIIPTIKFIQDIPILACIKLEQCTCCHSNRKQITFVIISEQIKSGPNYENYVLYSKCLKEDIYFKQKDFQDIINKIKKLLPNLKINKVTGIIEHIYDKTYEQICLDEFGTNYFCNTNCSICDEKTLTKTNCNHPICVECWSQIKNKTCPLCRQDNIHIKL
jgi:hypothetical protein